MGGEVEDTPRMPKRAAGSSSRQQAAEAKPFTSLARALSPLCIPRLERDCEGRRRLNRSSHDRTWMGAVINSGLRRFSISVRCASSISLPSRAPMQVNLVLPSSDCTRQITRPARRIAAFTRRLSNRTSARPPAPPAPPEAAEAAVEVVKTSIGSSSILPAHSAGISS